MHLDDSQPLQLPPSETKAAYIEADPCLEHRISVIIELKQASGSEGGLSSPDSLYNTDLKIERIYSGLLGGKFSEQLCAKSNKSNTTELMIPEIPVALKHCVKVNLDSEDPSQFDISIVDPRGGQGRSDIKVHCKNPTVLNEAMQPHTNNFDEWVLPTIIGTTLLVIVLIVVVISCKKKHKKESEASTDVNPVYEGAADYDYDEMNYSTMATEDSVKVTVNKKEVLDSSFNVTSIFFSFDF